MFEKNMNISFLLDFYGEVLDERPRRVLDLYYNEDLSLAEISESESMTRQGVRHIVKKAEDDLLTLENKLGLANRFLKVHELGNSISSSLNEIYLQIKNSNPEIAECLRKQIKLIESMAQIEV